MHHPTYRIAPTTAFVTPVVEHWLEREIVHPTTHRTISERSNHRATSHCMIIMIMMIIIIISVLHSRQLLIIIYGLPTGSPDVSYDNLTAEYYNLHFFYCPVYIIWLD